MDYDFSRILKYSLQFYLKRINLIGLFSIPFIFAFLIPVLVPAPTYLALGGLFLRTGSIPDLSILDLLVTIVGYAISVFLIADSIVNINLIIRSKRTLTEVTSEIVNAMGTFGVRIFVIYTVILALLFFMQVLTYESPLQSVIYPLFSLLLSFCLFFVAPAVVIDNSGLIEAIGKSVDLAFRKPLYIIFWFVSVLVILSLFKVFFDLFLPSFVSGYLLLILNSLFILPFFTILQTQMYMEKYPLAK